MTPNWKSLAPHRPVAPGSPEYVARPDLGGRRIADLVRSGRSTVLVVGPVGIGKSTELGQAAQYLREDRITCLVSLGRDGVPDVQQITPEGLLLAIAGRVGQHAVGVARLALSPALRSTLVYRGLLDPQHKPGHPERSADTTPADIARATLLEVARLSGTAAVTILVDGLERALPERARALFGALAELPEDVEIVAVVPWHAAYGPEAKEVIRAGERLIVIRPVPVDKEAGADGRRFLASLLAKRLDLPVEEFARPGPDTASDQPPSALATPTIRDVVEQAATWSGGVPRVFLQLVGDAASYARLDRGADWPELLDLELAVRDQQESNRRLLLPGDDEALGKANGTDGRELELDRKLRLLGNGLLVEEGIDGRATLRIHPLVRPILRVPSPFIGRR